MKRINDNSLWGRRAVCIQWSLFVAINSHEEMRPRLV